MNIQPITMSLLTTVITTLNDTHYTIDNPVQGTLSVQISEATPQFRLVISGSDYTNLGEWTDSSLNQYIINRFGLTVITGSISGNGQ